jgi:hypothetical protein
MPPTANFATDTGGRAATDVSITDFTFVPQELIAKCRSLIEMYHKFHGYSCLPDMLWHADSRGFIQSNKELRRIFKQASMARAVRRTNNVLLFVATVIMALEALARNFAAWGTRFPEARQKAANLLGASAPRVRVWFMDAYLHTPQAVDRNSILIFVPRTIDAPPL